MTPRSSWRTGWSRWSPGRLDTITVIDLSAPLGPWAQGAAFPADGRTVLVGNMIGRLQVGGGSAALRTAER